MQTNVRVTRTINAPIEVAWKVARPFDNVKSWSKGVKDVTFKDGANPFQVGGKRVIELADGATVEEILLTLDDINHVQTYGIVASPFKATNYVGKLTLTNAGDSKLLCNAVWEAQFNCEQADRDGLVNTISNLFVDLLNGLDTEASAANK